MKKRTTEPSAPTPPAEPSAHFHARPRGDATREKILAAALTLFRKHGLEKTTMRQVAEAAGVALGGAYYYFPSKESLVLAYYEQTHVDREAASQAAFAHAATTRARLGAVYTATFDWLRRDRKLLGALFAFSGDAAHPLSVFSAKSRGVRERNVALFREALSQEESLPEAVRELAAWALWAMQMALLLYFINDASPGQARTRALADRALDLVAASLPMAGLLEPIAREVRAILAEAGLIPAESR